jgi:signal transduction histidine kinase
MAGLDAATVIKASQAVSGEILVDRLAETLMKIALQYAGAERGLLILPHGADYRIEAEARTGRGTIEVSLRQADVTAAELAESVLRTVVRTRESVILHDAGESRAFSTDAYVLERRPRSVLCLPLVKQTKLLGALYLENNLTFGAFTSDRIAVLELLASQAAISLENAVLYSDLLRENTERKRVEEELRRSEAMLTQAEAISQMGSWQWNIDKDEMSRSKGHLRIFGFGPEDAKAPVAVFRERIHPDDRALAMEPWTQAVREKNGFEVDYRIVLPDGSMKYVHLVVRAFVTQSGELEFIGTSMDTTQRRRADETLRQALADLAHANRVTTMGELTASLAHEVNQPISAAVTNAESCLSWLAGDIPNIAEARATASSIVKNGMRAAEIITRIRLLFKHDAPQRDSLDINDVVRDMIVLLRAETSRFSIAVRAELAADLSHVMGDRVQLQQVLMNLMMNSIDAMKDADGARELTIKSQPAEDGQVMVSVSDTGVGLPRCQTEQIFKAFFTTKPDGIGMGLSISRSIVESHGGHLCATENAWRGASFHFILPAED